MIEIKELSKYFNVGGKKLHAVDNVSLNIKENEIVGLVGESGSGKSTLGKCLVGLHPKTAGLIRYKGEELPDKYSTDDYVRLSSEMQMIFQDPYSSLNPRMTVREIIAEGLKLSGLEKNAKRRQEMVAHWLKKVGLHADHMSRYPHEFSGGQRQRIGVARALIVKPKFVVCDEPISALDVSVQAQVVNLLNDLKNEMGLTLLVIAHDLSMVRYISDRMAVMYLGTLVEEGPANEVFFNPKHPYTKMLVSSNPEPDPKKERQRERSLITGEVPSPLDVGQGCRFASRCSEVREECHFRTPAKSKVGDGHSVACHLYSE